MPPLPSFFYYKCDHSTKSERKKTGVGGGGGGDYYIPDMICEDKQDWPIELESDEGGGAGERELTSFAQSEKNWVEPEV